MIEVLEVTSTECNNFFGYIPQQCSITKRKSTFGSLIKHRTGARKMLRCVTIFDHCSGRGYSAVGSATDITVHFAVQRPSFYRVGSIPGCGKDLTSSNRVKITVQTRLRRACCPPCTHARRTSCARRKNPCSSFGKSRLCAGDMETPIHMHLGGVTL